MKTATLSLIAALILIAPTGALAQQQGPNLLLTAQRLQEIKDAYNRGDPVFVQGWDEAVTAADAYLNVSPDPIRGALKVPGFYTSQRAQQQQIVRQLRGDARAANALAFAFALTGRADYADKAKAFVLAWVDNLTHAEDGGQWWQRLTGDHRGDTPLAIAYSFPNFIYAWDTLQGLGQVSQAEHARFAPWLRRFVDYHRREEGFKNNHHDWQALFLLASGHVLGDRALFDRALGFYRNGMACNSIARDGALWRELLREEKAATYTLMALEAKVQVVVIAEHNGVTNLRDIRAGRRGLLSEIVLRGWSLNLFSSIPVPKDGGTLRDGVNLLRDFLELPSSWDRFRKLTKKPTLNGPAQAGDWGWLFEVANHWWNDPRDRNQLGRAPYGPQPERAYTLANATLLFRPVATTGLTGLIGGAPSTPAPTTPGTASTP